MVDVADFNYHLEFLCCSVLHQRRTGYDQPKVFECKCMFVDEVEWGLMPEVVRKWQNHKIPVVEVVGDAG